MIAGLSRGQLIVAVAAIVALPVAWFLFPKDPLETGTQLARNGRMDEALEVWTKACERKKHIESCSAAAIVWLQREEIEKAKALVAKAVDAEPKHVWSLVLRGRVLEVEGKPDDARAVYEEAEKLHPDSALPPTSLAKLAIERGDYAEAERCAERAVAAEPDKGSGYAMRGQVLVLNSSLQEAISAFDAAAERDGLSGADWVVFADTYERVHGREGEARMVKRQILEDGAERSPNDPSVLTALGVQRYMDDDVEGAVEALRLACDLTKLPEPRVHLGITFLETGRPDFAIPRFEEALAVDRDNVEIQHLLATALANNAENARALEWMEKILARKDLTAKQRTATLFLRARVHETAGHADDAMRDVRELLVLDPAMLEANWLCGHIALDQGRNDDAKACLEKAAVGKGAAEVVVLQDLARLKARTGPMGEAMGYLEVLFGMRAVDANWVKAHPEFRVLEKQERFQLLLEGGSDDAEPDDPLGLGP